MYDIINDKCEQENPDIILRRFEQQVKDRLQEKDIIALSISVHSFVLKWGLIWPRPDEIDDPYAYLEHALDIARPKARAYFYIGKAVSKRKQEGRWVPPWLALPFQAAELLVFNKLKNRFGGKMRFFVSGGAPLAL
ncbi:MAG: hypothetical protein HN337_07295, partial [Deltaproteobacteria bacterium]|nr:hypothetical protein [Deltaproteobacteria bacterium]